MTDKVIFANLIVDDGRYKLGICALDATVLENIRIIYGEQDAKKIVYLLKNAHPDGGYLIGRFCQFVTFIQYQPVLGFSMKLSDFAGSVDIALDDYIDLRKAEWLPEDRNKIMLMFQEIAEKPQGIAEIIVKDRVPL